MKKSILTLFIIGITLNCVAQKVEILDIAKELPEKEYSHYVYESSFDYLHKNTETDSYQYVATIRGKNKFVINAYRNIMRKAEHLGANCFKLESYKFDEDADNEELVLKTFYATEKQLNANRDRRDSLALYIFADEYQSFELLINDKLVTIPFGQYVYLSLREYNQVKIDNSNKRIIKPLTITRHTKGLPAFLGIGNMHYDGARTGGSVGTTTGIAAGGILGGLIAHGINSKINAVYLPPEFALLLKDTKKEVIVKY